MRCSPSRALLLAGLLAIVPPCLAGGADVPGLVNLGFEDGKKSWNAWHSDSSASFEWDIDRAMFREGKASLRIAAGSRKGRIFVHQSTKQFTRGTRYELSYWIRFSSPEMYPHCSVALNLVKHKPGGKGRDLVAIDPVTFYKRGDGGWLHRKGFFVAGQDTDELQIGLSARTTLGSVWFDDIRLKEVPPGELRVESMHDYTPSLVDHGPEMVKRFEAVRAGKLDFLSRAKVYNRLLVESAHLSGELHRLVRAASYLSAHGKDQSIASQEETAAKIEKELDALYLAYGKAFKERTEDGLAAFGGGAKALEPRIAAARRGVRDRTQALAETARKMGLRWTAHPLPAEREMAIAPDGKPNQFIFGTVSLQSHYELEEPLSVNRLFASSIFDAKGTGPGKYDFSGVLNSWEFHKRLGVKHSSIGTALAVHSNQMAPKWFLDKFAADDDIFCVGADGKKALRPAWSIGAPLNTWRPEVRQMTADMIAQIGKTFRESPHYLFYVVAPENGGPYFSSENGGRSIGYNKSALPDFHAWLKRRYGNIEELNRQWQTEHKSFEAIQPPPDLLVANEYALPHPLAYEFQSWRNAHHHGWLKLLYDEFKKADPNKPVMADHSSLLSHIDGSRIFETADILSVHHHPQVTPTIATTYASSLNRFAKKHLALYENGWGCAEPMPHHTSELEQRAALTKYLYRLTAWGAHTQMWWYAYTSNDYMTRFNGNWFNPVYDLTTLRYSAAGLPAAKARVKRLEEVFLNSTIQKPRAVMLQPVTSMLFQNYWKESYAEMERLHDLLQARNSLPDILPESYFTDGPAKLDEYAVVILPYMQFFPDKLAMQLREWVRKGGTLVALGPFGLYDKFGFDNSAFWQEVFGKELPKRMTKPYPSWAQNREWRWGWDEQKAELPLLEKAFGAGRVVAAMRSLQSAALHDNQAVRRLEEAVEVKAERAAVCSDNLFEVTLLEAPGGKKYLCAINPHTSGTGGHGTLTVAGEYLSVVDLDVPGGFPVPFKTNRGTTAFTVRLGPGDFTLIELRK